MSLRVLSGAALCAAAFCSFSVSTGAQECNLRFVPTPYPEIPGVQEFVGYQGSGYSKMDLWAPEPIPLGLDIDDQDKLLIYCGGSCYEFDLPGVWIGDWEVKSGSGGYVDADAQVVDQIKDASHVLFLPSSDLDPGESASTVLLARVFDGCAIGGFDDPQSKVEFTIDVARSAALPGKYDVSARLSSVDIPTQMGVLCGMQQTVCELLDNWDPYLPPTADIVRYPSAGMVLGELRPIHGKGEDIDRVVVECGTPPGYWPPAGNYGEQAYCDRPIYKWSIVSGPGSGIFLVHDRTTLFRATMPGLITIKLEVATADGELASAFKSFEIFPAEVARLSYAGGQSIAKDADASAYDKPHWEDQNDDGDAADPGERRISVAYARGENVEVERIFLDCDTPAPPHAVFRGVAPDNQEFEGANCEDPMAGPEELVACDLVASEALPNRVQKYDPFAIDWEVSFGDDYWVPVGQTETWLYATLAQPVLNYPGFESVYDISCQAADGATNSSLAGTLIWLHFAGLDVERKERDGMNAMDGQRLGYWLPGVSQCIDMEAMLASADGSGQCGAWAQLFKACLEVQGIGGATIYFAGYDSPSGIRQMLMKHWVKADDWLTVGPNGINDSMVSASDDQVIATGMGEPGGLAVSAGANGVLDSTPAGDDGVSGVTIHTGADGVCQTTAAGDDVQVVALGNGHVPAPPDYVDSVRPGLDHVLDTVPAGDDFAVEPPDENLRIDVDYFHTGSVPAQNNPDPPNRFTNHYVVLVQNQIFDPSYGTGPFFAAQDFENASIDALSEDNVFARLQIPWILELIYLPTSN